jgi:hypothetical protein
VNTYGAPPPNCTDTAPAPDCSATPRPMLGMDTSSNIYKPYRQGYTLGVGVDPGSRTRPPFKSCLIDESSVTGAMSCRHRIFWPI